MAAKVTEGGEGDDPSEPDAAGETGSEFVSEPPPDPAWDAEWVWLTQRFPEIGQYELPRAGLLAALLDWAREGEKVAVYDRACRPALVTRRRGELHGLVHRGFQFIPGAPDEMSESISELHIGWRFHEFDSNWTHYQRDAKGSWVESGSGGFSDGGWEVEHRLSAVTTDAAWFGDALISLRIACSRLVDEESRCTGGGQRTCRRCEGWAPFATSHESNVGIHRDPARRRVKGTTATDCNVACPAIEEPPEVMRANLALREREFRTSLDADPKPLLFRTEAACRKHTKQHRFSADELEAWRGHATEVR